MILGRHRYSNRATGIWVLYKVVFKDVLGQARNWTRNNNECRKPKPHTHYVTTNLVCRCGTRTIKPGQKTEAKSKANLWPLIFTSSWQNVFSFKMISKARNSTLLYDMQYSNILVIRIWGILRVTMDWQSLRNPQDILVSQHSQRIKKVLLICDLAKLHWSHQMVSLVKVHECHHNDRTWFPPSQHCEAFMTSILASTSFVTTAVQQCRFFSHSESRGFNLNHSPCWCKCMRILYQKASVSLAFPYISSIQTLSQGTSNPATPPAKARPTAFVSISSTIQTSEKLGVCNRVLQLSSCHCISLPHHCSSLLCQTVVHLYSAKPSKASHGRDSHQTVLNAWRTTGTGKSSTSRKGREGLARGKLCRRQCLSTFRTSRVGMPINTTPSIFSNHWSCWWCNTCFKNMICTSTMHDISCG